MTRTLQEIFDEVIDSGIYYDGVYFPFMCTALYNACRHNIITYEEYEYAEGKIIQYLQHFYTLKTALRTNNLPFDAAACKAVYRDWDSRPQLRYKK